jgi:hypothetical protein
LASTNEKEDISVLEVVWYETFNDKSKVSNSSVEGQFYKISMKMEVYQDGM